MKKYEIELNGKPLSIQTGQVARQSSGSVIVQYGETTILTAVNAAKTMREDIDWFPLQVEYRERHYAAGKIPGGFFKREARPSEHEVLTSRLTDRPIRPLFPKSFRYETQVMITTLSSDGENMADTLAGVGASCALMISDIPWNGPIASVRVGRCSGEFVVNPTRSEISESDMDIIVSGNEQTVVMVEGGAKMVSEEDFLLALEFAHGFIKQIIDLQKKVVADFDVVKREIPAADENKELEKAVESAVKADISKAIQIFDKLEREKTIEDIHEKALNDMEETYPDSEQMIDAYVSDQLKEAFREQILAQGVRSDGRKSTDIRPITIETDFLPRTHGSALFTRGETQALVVLTLGSPRDEQIIDTMDLDAKKNFMLHYNFPPYCVGETGRIGFTSRREIGHGHLAERSLKHALPDYDDFPYTIRLVSEIMESNGSSSMASICGGSLALISGGAPIKGHVAGIAMGLVTDGKRHAVLSDILGAEDHLGDMDFKVAGTREGITAIQLDLKIEGISFSLLKEALAQVDEDYDVVVIDCPPRLGFLTMSALSAATGVLVTIHPEMLDVMSMSQFLRMTADLMDVIAESGADMSHDWMRYVLTRYEPQDAPQNRIVACLRTMYSEAGLNWPMLKSTAISDAGLTKQTLYEVERSAFTRSTYDRAIESLNTLNDEIADLIQKTWGRT